MEIKKTGVIRDEMFEGKDLNTFIPSISLVYPDDKFPKMSEEKIVLLFDSEKVTTEVFNLVGTQNFTKFSKKMSKELYTKFKSSDKETSNRIFATIPLSISEKILKDDSYTREEKILFATDALEMFNNNFDTVYCSRVVIDELGIADDTMFFLKHVNLSVMSNDFMDKLTIEDIDYNLANYYYYSIYEESLIYKQRERKLHDNDSIDKDLTMVQTQAELAKVKNGPLARLFNRK